MHRTDGVTVLSPTDLVGFLDCDHLTQLELAVTRGERVRPTRDDPELDLLARKGMAHESAHRERLLAEHGEVVTIPDRGSSLPELRAAEADTLAAMRAGAEVVYQAAFFDGTWRGRADFLMRVAMPSDLGDWSYEVADTKLARSVKVAALLQMCDYSQQVARLQGVAPVSMHVVLGSGITETHRVADYDAYHRAARRRLEQTVLDHPAATYPEPVEHCGRCRWLDVCMAQRRADDHLSLVAFMRRDQTRRLREVGIGTVSALAAATDARGADIGNASWERLHQQARLQVAERRGRRPVYEILPVERRGLGLSALPPPSAGDLFFDMEGDPFVADGGLEYLFGVTEVVAGAPRFHPLWAHDRAAEKVAFEAAVDLIIERLEHDPGMHVYHYAAYEESALKRLMGRHATREDEVDRLLRGGVLVDLYQVVRQGVRVSRESYSLKSLEPYYMASRQDSIADATASIVAYERWIESRDDALLRDIATYNERDCESTLRLRDWLERLRDELGATTGEAVPRPEPRSGEPTAALAAAAAQTRATVEALTATVPADPSRRDQAQSAQWLLAQLLDWHRREAKSEWWAFFDRMDKTDRELVDDAEAIGELRHLGEVGVDKQSAVHRYAFDPAQEHKLDIGRMPCDPRTGRDCGTILALDNDAGLVDLKRGRSLAQVAHPTSLIPGRPIATDAQRAALLRVAADLVRRGADAPGRYRALRDLLLGRPPLPAAAAPGDPLVRQGETPAEAVSRIVGTAEAACLAVQGPPGTGKTHTGAEVIVDLVARGRRVGVTATSHRAISNLLAEICRAASRRGQRVRVLQRCDPEELCDGDGVERAGQNGAVVTALEAGAVDVVAGTAWLFSDAHLDGALDVLVVDEAGQMSLANVVAVGTAARSIVLLGDPQQLAQPSHGVHPDGADCSALDTLLRGHDTVPSDRGVFLETTWRMHPEVCGFVSEAFYDGRLRSRDACALQVVEAGGALGGAGTRLAGVEHRGRTTSSPEEVVAVRAILTALVGRRWVDADGVGRPMGLDDILVVAPYNAQVRRLRQGLPEGARIGTVDRFQGQEAAVAVYSMTTSSAEDLPRSLDFLFSRNRMNVAVSRARALAVVVCSPALFHARCHTGTQLRLVSALCRFAESAAVLEV